MDPCARLTEKSEGPAVGLLSEKSNGRFGEARLTAQGSVFDR